MSKLMKAMTPAQKVELWGAVFGEGRTQKDMARELGFSENTIGKHCNSKEGKAAEKKIHEEMARKARGRLARAAEDAANSWIEQLENANKGERAQHLPAKDLLTHIGAVDIAVPNTAKGTQILIQIGTGTPQDVEAEVIEVD